MMSAPSHENAMTEIALALAMGFFSILVLTLISFGTPDAKALSIKAVSVSPSPDGTAGEQAVETDDLVVVFHNGGFMDKSMTPLLPAAITAHPGRIILAIDPAASLQSVLAARTQIKTDNILVTELDGTWRDALKNRGGVRP